jgi:hypothetical protein
MRLKLKGTHQLLAYADDVNLTGDNIDTIKKTQKFKLMLVWNRARRTECSWLTLKRPSLYWTELRARIVSTRR